MISASRAKDRIKKLSANELRELVAQRLLGQDTTPVERARADEPSEDLVIVLLRIDGLAKETRAAVIQGVKDVHLQLYTWLVSQESHDPKLDAERIAVRYCRTIDVAAPIEIFPDVSSLLRLVLDLPAVSTVVQKAVVRAALGYPKREAHVEIWTDAIKVPELAPYAFSALLQIKPRAPRIQAALIQLFRRKYSDDWPVNAAGLLGRANRARGDEVLVRRVLSALERDATTSPAAGETWEKIKTDLKRTARTNAWLEHVEVRAEPVRNAVPLSVATMRPDANTGATIWIQETAVGMTTHKTNISISTEQNEFTLRYELNDLVAAFAEAHGIAIERSDQDSKLRIYA